MTRQKRWIAILSLGIPFVYVLGVCLCSRISSINFNDIVIFAPARTDPLSVSLTIKPLTTVSAMLLIYMLPGLLWTLAVARPFRNYAPMLGTAFAVNTLMLILSTTLFKLQTHSPLNRVNFMVIIVLLTVSGLVYLLTRSNLPEKMKYLRRIGKYEITVGLAGVIFVLLLLICFRGKVFLENLNGDGSEQFRLASSLREHSLPYWVLLGHEEGEENGKEGSTLLARRKQDSVSGMESERNEQFGFPIVNPNTIYPWLASFSLLLLGECEGALRLPFFVYLLGVYAVVIILIKPDRGRAFPALFTVLILLLYTIIMFFYTGYNPYFADIAAPPALDTLLTLFLLLEIYFLLNRNKTLFVIFAVFSALTRYSGPVFTIILLVVYRILFKENRKFLRRAALQYAIGVLLIGAAYLFYGWTHGHLGYWEISARVEYLNDYVSPNSMSNIVLFGKYFVILAGGLPVLGLCFLKSKDDTSRLLSPLTLTYLLIVLSSGGKSIHYLAPIALMPTIVFLRQVSMLDKKHMVLVSRILCLAIAGWLIAMSLPRKHYVNTAHREFGARTCMMFSSYEEAAEHAGIIYSLYEDGEIGWYIGKDTWVEYADISRHPPKGRYDFYLTDSEQPPEAGFQLVGSVGDETYFYARNQSKLREIRDKYVPDRKSIFSSLFREMAVKYGAR